MHLSAIVTEIWRLKYNVFDLLDVIGQVTIRLPEVDFLWVVHSDHASLWHRYGNIAPQMLDT